MAGPVQRLDATVLVADDDGVLRTLLRDILEKEGYAVLEAADGRDAVDAFFGPKPVDLVVLDVMMPRLDGWGALAEIRERSEVPVLMLTALGDEGHEVKGLRAGADDYVAKPFRYAVFLARVNALLRPVLKARGDASERGGIRLDPATREVVADGAPVALDAKEFALLALLMRNPGRVLTRERILDAVWGMDYDGDMRTIDTHVKTLRAKLGAAGARVATVRGAGYRFEEAAPTKEATKAREAAP